MQNRAQRPVLVDLIISIIALGVLFSTLTFLPRILLPALNPIWVSLLTSMLFGIEAGVATYLLVRTRRFMVVPLAIMLLGIFLVWSAYYVKETTLPWNVNLFSSGVTVTALAFTLFTFFQERGTTARQPAPTTTAVIQRNTAAPTTDTQASVGNSYRLMTALSLGLVIGYLLTRRQDKRN